MFYAEAEAQPDAFHNILDTFWWSIVTFTVPTFVDTEDPLAFVIVPLMLPLKFDPFLRLQLSVELLPTRIVPSSFWNVVTKIYDFLLRFRIIISKNPASQDKICLNDKFWSGTVLDFPDENKNL